MSSNKIYHIEYIFGNPNIYKNISRTEMMSKKIAFETWATMNNNNGRCHRMWLMKNNKTLEISECENEWEFDHPKDLQLDD